MTWVMDRMKRMLGALAYVATAGVAIGACSDEGSGAGAEESGEETGSGGAENTGGSTSAPSGGSQPGGSGGMGTENPNECALQGEYQAATEQTLPDPKCNYPLISSGPYNLTIEGETITVEQPVERFPMTGTINAECEAVVLIDSPTYREFRFELDPDTMSGSGTLTVKRTSDGCSATFDLSMALEVGHW